MKVLWPRLPPGWLVSGHAWWAMTTLFVALAAVESTCGVTIRDPNFQVERIHRGGGMIPIVFGPGGRIYIGEKGGKVILLKPGVAPGTFLPAIELTRLPLTASSGESGLLGLAAHPEFQTNRWLYAFYSRNGLPLDQRLVRLQVDPSFDSITAPPEVLLDGLPFTESTHNAGDIQFHPTEGLLYITLGDDRRTSAVQDLDRYEGKLLRLDDEGRGLTSNPYYDGDVTSLRSRIWGLGARNPFRFAFHPVTHDLYVSENGEVKDRVSLWSAPAANGGWPGEFDTPSDPKITNVLSLQTPSLTGIAIVRGGPFADPDFPDSDALYVANWSLSKIRRWRLTGTDLDSAVPINSGVNNDFITSLFLPAHMAFGLDGALYITTASDNGSGFLYRVSVIPRGFQLPADGNQDAKIDIDDAVWLLGYLFGSTTEAPCAATGGNIALLDTNGDGAVDIADPIAVLLHLFAGGSGPVLGTDCEELLWCPTLCTP